MHGFDAVAVEQEGGGQRLQDLASSILPEARPAVQSAH